MPEMQSQATAVWQGDMKKGNGNVVMGNGSVRELNVTVPFRAKENPGATPEEILAGSHAACFGISLAMVLSQMGVTAQEITTRAVTAMESNQGGYKITHIHLEVEGKVPNIDEEAFRQAAEQAEKFCPVSNLLRAGLDALTLETRLVQV